MIEMANVFHKVLSEIPSNKTVNMDYLAIQLTTDVILRAIVSEEHQELLQLNTDVGIRTWFNTGNEYMMYMFAHPLHVLNIPYHFEFYRCQKNLRHFFTKRIPSRRKELQAGREPKDLMDLLIMSTDDETGQTLSDEDIYSQCVTFFFAGHDTSGHTFAWCCYLIGQHPEVEKKVLEEVDTVLKDKDAPSLSDLGKLPYLTCVIKETLRLYPPSFNFGRYARDPSQPWMVKNYKMDGDIQVVFSVPTIHTHEKYWEDPFIFNPERFLSDQLPHPYAFIPFAKGERSCIGQNFAMMEIKTLLCMTFKKYVFRADPLDGPTISSKNMTLCAKSIPLFVRSRKTN